MSTTQNSSTEQNTCNTVHNTISWASLPVVDLDRAIAFYSVALGKKVEKASFEVPGVGQVEFALLPHDNNNVSCSLCVMPDRKPSADGALIYINMNGRLQEAIDLATKNGGRLVRGIQTGEHGSDALIADTEGNVVSFHSW